MIYSVLVIAEREEFGPCLASVVRDHGCAVTLVESLQDTAGNNFDLVIATNTSLSPAHLRSAVPDIKARHPHARIMVLSGYHPADFVADLTRVGMDRFLPLPFNQHTLLHEITGLLSGPPC